MHKLLWGSAWVVLMAGAYAGAQTATTPASAPATAPATASAPASRPLTSTMEFQFENATISSVLDEMSTRLGFIIEKTVPLNGKLSVMAPKAVNADEAIILLNSLLVPLGYGAVERPPLKMLDGTSARVLRVMTWAQAKKEAPLPK